MDTTTPSYVLYDLLAPQRSMLEEVIEGLSRPRKEMQSKYFYDARGCELFEAICDLPEYYPTRSEIAIMRDHSDEMAAAMAPGCAVIEIGCGNSAKTQQLLQALRPPVFVPVDIASEQLQTSCNALKQSFPAMTIAAVRADFNLPIDLGFSELRHTPDRLLYFPGSTIGNLTPPEAQQFLERWRPLLGDRGGALIGVDLRKDAALLNAAYNDAQGVTAAFNLNLLERCNRELGANFDLSAFSHRAYFNADIGRVEMHLVSAREQRVNMGDCVFDFDRGETIHTENSCKYSINGFQELARNAGFNPAQHWTDNDGLFSVHYLKVH